MKKIYFSLVLFIFINEMAIAQNSFPMPTGVVQINDKTAINRLLFQEIAEPNGESLVSLITGQQRGLLVKDRANFTGGLWLFGGGVVSPTNAGGVGAGFVGDMGTYIPLAQATSAITFLDGKINFFANKGLSVGQSYWPSPKMSLDADGNVGIGTTSPQEKLHVEGNMYLGTNQLQFLSANGGNNRIQSSGGSSGLGTWTFKSRFDNLILDAGEDVNNLRKIVFKTGGTDRMLVDNAGNVGIGTTTPDAKLAVKGTIHAQEVKVDLNVPGPDYVFNDDYKLLSLAEIKTYIDKNKHRPEVPSAKEMEANGVNLGEMNMLLLKKIEELTLYAIEAKYRLDEQQKLMDEIMSENKSIMNKLNKN